jgi:hypothetical protein
MLQRVLALLAPKLQLKEYITSKLTVDVILTYTSSTWYIFVGMWITCMTNTVFIY